MMSAMSAIACTGLGTVAEPTFMVGTWRVSAVPVSPVVAGSQAVNL